MSSTLCDQPADQGTFPHARAGQRVTLRARNRLVVAGEDGSVEPDEAGVGPHPGLAEWSVSTAPDLNEMVSGA